MKLKVREAIAANEGLKIVVASKKVVGKLYQKLATFKRLSLNPTVDNFTDKRNTLQSEYSDPVKDEKGSLTGQTMILDSAKAKLFQASLVSELNAEIEIDDDVITKIPLSVLQDACPGNLDVVSALEWMIVDDTTETEKADIPAV
jgi:hypothetical protein